MILTTTNSVDGKTIKEYLDIVNGNSDTIIDNIRGNQGVSGALNEMKKTATELGADAIVGVQFVGPTAHYYDTIHIYGTAVKFK